VVETAGTDTKQATENKWTQNGASHAQQATRRPSPQVPPYEAPHLGTRPVQSRPLIPFVDPQEVIDSVLGTNLSGRVNNSMPSFLKGLQNLDTRDPLIYKPTVVNQPPDSVSAQLPFMLYLPGIDGTGLAAYRQFPVLSRFFDLHALYVPPSDRSSFEQIVEAAKVQLEAKLAGGDELRPVYLLGESFGGLVALELARRCGNIVDRVVLVNPATSFGDSPWPQAGQLLTSLPEAVYNTLPIGLSPIISNPISVAMNNVSPKAPQADAASQFAWGLIDLLPELGSLRNVLPAPTLAHRLNLLKEGAIYVNARLDQIAQRVLLIVGSNDLVIPSNAEGPRLKRSLARCRLEVLQGRSHAVMQEAGVDIMAIMSDAGFYTPKRVLSSRFQTKESRGSKRGRGGSNGNGASSSNGGPETNGIPSRNGSSTVAAASVSDSEVAREKTDAPASQIAETNGGAPHQNGSTNSTTLVAAAAAAAAGSNGMKGSASKDNSSSTVPEAPAKVPQGGANFGKPLPVELPTPKEVDLAMEEGGVLSVANLNRLVSPMFFSTDAETGQVMPGLGGVPTGQPGRPVLLIGNHQLFAPDMPLMVVQFLKEKGVLLRGLAHPAVFTGTLDQAEQSKPDSSNSGSNNSSNGSSSSSSSSSSLSPAFGDRGADSRAQNAGPGAFLSSLVRGQGGRPLTAEQRQQQDAAARAAANPFSSFLTTFGAVPVSGFSLHRLLSQGETVFLFPGGAREALKRKDERYTLIWPEKSEFVRMAARFGATIVPFGAVGAEDCFNQVLDGDDVLNLPVVGDFFRERSSRIPQARRGVNVSEEHVDQFVQPLITFNAPSRFYYAFGRPITTTPEMANNKAECEEVYQEVRGGVDDCLSWLLRNRERDPYKDVLKRVAYEYAWGGSRKAPTFSLPGEAQRKEQQQQDVQKQGSPQLEEQKQPQ